MLKQEDFGPVRFYRYTRTLFGRPMMRVGVYRIGDLLIDTGPAKAAGLAEALVADGPVSTVVLTHHHEDHSGNAARVAAASGCRVLAHRSGLGLLTTPPALPFYRRVFWGNPDPVSADPLGETLETERHTFRVIHTPGHAVDHVALHVPEQDWLFVGDLYLTDRPRFAFTGDDIGTIIDSIRKLLAIPDCVMFCQHTGYHAGHQHRLGRRLDSLLGLQQRAIVCLEEGQSPREIVRSLGLRDGMLSWVTGGELSARHLVLGLLRHAGKIA